MWQDIKGHEQNKAFLEKLAIEGNPSSALLFYGPEGIGKRQMALAFARRFLCPAHADEDDGCMSCKFLRHESHPDFILVKQEADEKKRLPREKEKELSRLEYLAYVKDSIGIKQIQELTQRASFAPTLSTAKICIIDGAERMTTEAQNCLLKLLEEPPAFWQFILLSSDTGRLLPTILSRVIRLRFDPLQQDQVEEILSSSLPGDAAATVALLAGGSPGRGLDMYELGVVEKRAEALEVLTALPVKSVTNYIGSLAWQDKLTAPEGRLFLELLLLLLRDGLFLKEGLDSEVINTDIISGLRKIKDWPGQTIERAIAVVNSCRRPLEGSTPVRTVLEALLLQLNGLWEED